MMTKEDMYEWHAIQNMDLMRLVDKYDLKKKTRIRSYCYKRFFIAHYMVRKRHLTVFVTGHLLGLDHSSISYGIKMHDLWWEHDPIYMNAIYPLPQILSGEHMPQTYNVDFEELDIEDTVVNIRGNFPPKLLTKFNKPMTGKELSTIFAMS